MEKIYTQGCQTLREFFVEIGIGFDGPNRHLVGKGYSGDYLLGNTDNYYYVDEDGLFQSVSRSRLPKEYKEVYVTQFIKYHKIRLKMDTITVTKQELGKIYEVACTTWRTKIQDLTLRNPFGTDVELSREEINEMFKAADANQTLVLESIFGEQHKEIDLRSNTINHTVDGIAVFGNSAMSRRGSLIGLPVTEATQCEFWLNPDYNWVLNDNNRLTVSRK